VVWFEIYADDVERAKAFYSRMFGWVWEPLAGYDAEYWTVDPGNGSVRGGLLKREQPPAPTQGTVLYIRVGDLEDSLRRAAALGAAVEREPTSITPAAGSFALVRDPEGNLLGLWSAPAEGRVG
jgi:predicted enzyme related to lactoylglutathione lyase